MAVLCSSAAAASVRHSAFLRRRLFLLSAAVILLAATPSKSIIPPPPPILSSSTAAASNSPHPPPPPPSAAPVKPSITTTNPPPYVPHGSNIYRDGLYAAFSALSNYTLMSELFLDMDLSWMDAALPCTLLVVRDGAGLDQLFNANTLGTLLAGQFQIQLFPSHAFKMSDLLQMTAGGQVAMVQTVMANRTVLVTRDNGGIGTGSGGTVILLDRVPIINGDVFIAPDNQLVAHGIPYPLPTTNTPPPPPTSSAPSPPFPSPLPTIYNNIILQLSFLFLVHYLQT